jgi:hypothetical protein
MLDTNVLSAFLEIGRYLARSIEPQFQSFETMSSAAGLSNVAPLRTPSRPAQKYSPGGGRRPAKGCSLRSASAAVLEIAVRTAPRRRARRVGSAFASSIPGGTDEALRIARQIDGRGRGRLMSYGLRHGRRRQQRGDARCRQDHFQVSCHGSTSCVSPGSHPASVSYATFRIAQETDPSPGHHEIVLGNIGTTVT